MHNFLSGVGRPYEGDQPQRMEETHMSDETLTTTDQAATAERLLQEMAAQNGGRLERNAASRLVLVHDLQSLLQR